MTDAQVRDWIARFAAAVADQKTELTVLDTAIGDGDHGTNLDRGMAKALERLEAVEAGDAGATLKAVGMALVSSVGGAAGPLYGTLFMQMGQAAEGGELDFAAALSAALDGVRARGKAEPGDKTMVDALAPAVEALAGGGDPAAGADAAEAGMKATIPLQARKGRASYLGPRSEGHQDPGATSTYLLLRSAAEALA